MEKLARKLRRSGYPSSMRHQVISEAVEKFKKMCKTEDEGGRPIHRAREWQKYSRRLEKEKKSTAWHNSGQSKISAPLIIDPTVGRLTQKMRSAYQKFSESMNIYVVVKVREEIGTLSTF